MVAAVAFYGAYFPHAVYRRWLEGEVRIVDLADRLLPHRVRTGDADLLRRARLIPLEQIDELITKNPYFSRTMIPANTYPRAFNNVDIETVGVNATLLTTASVPDDVVYAFTKAVFEYIETLPGYDDDFSAMMNDRLLEGLTAPIHPGALRFYREKGLQIPQD